MDAAGAVNAGMAFLDGLFSNQTASDGTGPGVGTVLSNENSAPGERIRAREGRRSSDTGGGVADDAAPSLSTAEEAEQHRLTQRTVLNLNAALTWLGANSPYFLLLLLTFVAYHCVEIWMIAWMLAVIVRSNISISTQIALRSDFKQHECVGLLLYIAFNSWIVVFLTAGLGDGRLWQYMLLQTPVQMTSVVDAVLLITMADSLLRMWNMIPKVLAVLLFQARALRRYHFASSVGPTVWGGWGQHGGSGSGGADGLEFCHARTIAQEGRLMTLLEYASRTYRLLLPTGIWCRLLMDSVSSSPLLCSVFVGAYLALKLFALLQHCHLLGLSCRSVWRRGAVHGRYTTLDELEEAGHAVCPICQDTVSKGVRLECCHVFCEHCIGEWLERGTTCPMCRTEVRPPGLVSFGDGRTSLLPTLF